MVILCVIGVLVIFFLIGYFSDQKYSNSKETTELLIAAGEGNLSKVKELIANGVNLNQQGVLGQTAIMMAAGAGHLKLLDYLVEQGGDLHIKTKTGKSALDLAIRNEEKEVIEYLRALRDYRGEK